MDITIYFIFAVLCGTVAYVVSRNRVTSPLTSFFVALIFPPAVFVYILTPKHKWEEARAARERRIAAIVKAGQQKESAQQQRQIEIDALLRRIEMNETTPIAVPGLMPMQGETFFYSERAKYGRTHTERQYVGSSPALYVPLGHGYRARVGGYRGRSQQVTNFAWMYDGIVCLSNYRIAFKADGAPDSAFAGFDAIRAYDCYPEGLGIQTEQGIMQFRTGNDVLGRAFQKIVDKRTSDNIAASKLIVQSRVQQ